MEYDIGLEALLGSLHTLHFDLYPRFAGFPARTARWGKSAVQRRRQTCVHVKATASRFEIPPTVCM